MLISQIEPMKCVKGHLKTYLTYFILTFAVGGVSNMKEVPLTQGKAALVDDEDYERVNQFKWYLVEAKYLRYANRSPYNKGKQSTLRMHRFILGLTDSKQHVDHINGNGLDNRKCNL